MFFLSILIPRDSHIVFPHNMEKTHMKTMHQYIVFANGKEWSAAIQTI